MLDREASGGLGSKTRRHSTDVIQSSPTSQSDPLGLSHGLRSIRALISSQPVEGRPEPIPEIPTASPKREPTFQDDKEPFSLQEPSDPPPDVSYDLDIIAVHGLGETPSSAWAFDITPPMVDGLTDQPKQDLLRQSKRKNPLKSKQESTVVETQIAEDGAPVAKQGLAPPENLESLDKRNQLLPEDPKKWSGQEKGTANNQVESWLQDDSPELPRVPPPRTSPARKVRWLRDFLPRDLKSARVLIFNYLQPPDEGKPPSLAALTQELCKRLVRVRRDCTSRPIIFVGQEFGVTVIERALMECAEDQNLVSEICRVTIGVLALTSSTVTTSKGDVDYFDLRETRFGPPKARVKHIEVHNEKDQDSHLDKFRSFTNWLSELRPAMGLYILKSDGKVRGRDDEAYRKTLSIISHILKAYPLLDAADIGDEEAVKTLLKAELNADLQDFAGRSALHLAVRKGHIQVVRILLSHGASVVLQDDKGMTALHFAVAFNPRSRDLMEMLLDEGAEVDTLNSAGDSVLELAVCAGVDPAFLKNRTLFKGPSEDVSTRRRDPVPPLLGHALEACDDFQATLAEFYLIEKQERFMIQRPSITELLYKSGPEKILAAARRREVSENLKPLCKWYHLPANNLSWVDDLFARMNIIPDSKADDEHCGRTPWSRYMRPKARMFKHIQHVEDGHGNWRTEKCSGEDFVLYIPFLNYERNCDLLDVYKMDERRRAYDWQEMLAAWKTEISRPPTPPESDHDEPGGILGAQPSHVSDHGGAVSENTTGKMPTWHARPTRESMSSTRKGFRDVEKPLDIEKKLLEGYVWNDTGALHLRRTLDQSHYFMLDDTSDRDWDQVVLREARRLAREAERKISRRRKRYVASVVDEKDDSEDYPLVIVDQLWLWVIGDTVVTSFPRKWRQPDWQLDGDVLEQLRQHLQTDKERAPIASAHDLANLIVYYCVSVFNRAMPNTGLPLHDHFESSVGLVADTETKLFREFMTASKEDPNEVIEKLGKKKLKTKRKQNEKGKEADETDDDDGDDLFDIRKEIKLLDEVKDIRDEIRMLLRVFNDQALAVGDVASLLHPEDMKVESPSLHGHAEAGPHTDAEATYAEDPHQIVTTFNEGTPQAPTRSDVVTAAYKKRHPIIDANIRDFERMLAHANASYEALNHLLDLKQKQANASEARLARIGAEANARQSNTIMVFTVATIVFGSLSFVAAFFALNVTAFPKQSDGTTAWNLAHIVGYVAGISICLSIPFVAIAFSINPLVDMAWSGDKSRKDKKSQRKSAFRRSSFGRWSRNLGCLWCFRKRKEETSSDSYYDDYYESTEYTSTSSPSPRKRSWPRRIARGLRRIPRLLSSLFWRVARKLGIVRRRTETRSTSYASSYASSSSTERRTRNSRRRASRR